MFDILTKVKKIFDPNEWELKKLNKHLEAVNALEQEMEKLSDDQLKGKTEEFKKHFKDGALLDDILPEAFAVVREVSRRTIGLRHYDVQIIGGIVLHQGRVSEMKTGEGKTLVSTLAVYLNALTGKGVHLVTVNDYLAKRDARWMGPIYHFLGLSVGVIQHEAAYIYDPDYLVGDESQDMLKNVHRKEAYAADITYGTNNEFGFDYLRDNMAMDLDDRVQRELHYAIVDEVDSILIDEARTPLIISGRGMESSEDYKKFARIAGRLENVKHYTVYEKEHSVVPTGEGYLRVAEYLGLRKKRPAVDYKDMSPFTFPDFEISEEDTASEDREGSSGKDLMAQINKSKKLIKRKKFEYAIETLNKVMEQEPDNILAALRKSEAYDKWGKKDDALKCMWEVTKLDTRFVGVIGSEGINYDKLRQLEEEIFPSVLSNEETPEDSEKQFIHWFNKGNAAFNIKDYKTAIAAFSRAVEIAPDSIKAWSNLGITHFDQGSHQKAIECLEKAVSLNPNFAEIQYNLGLAYRYYNMFEKALAAYEKACSLNPMFYEAYNNEGVVYVKLDKASEALSNFEKAAELEKESLGENYDSNKSFVLENYERIKDEIQALSSESHNKFPGYDVTEHEDSDIEYYLQNALKAKELYKRDVDYVLKDDQIVIVDEFTGRLMFGRRYSDGLHQAIEAKENVKVRSEDQTLASITFQNYFRMYEKLAGMTGTAATEEKEFRQIYNVDVMVIPTNKPIARSDFPDRIFRSEAAKFRAIVSEIEEMHQMGRPVLVGTRSIEKSELLSGMLKKKGIKHNVLNAKHHEREAQIIAEAGKVGAATIATNMAGRGVDIILGGVPPTSEYEKLKYESAKNHLDLVNKQLALLREELAQKEQEHETLQGDLNESFFRMQKHVSLPENEEKENLVKQESETNRKLNNDISLLNESIRELKTRIKTNVESLPELESALNKAKEELQKKESEVASALKEYAADQETVKKSGGLHIIGSERHESRRIDNQLRGRAGRQGDPGSSRFYVALDDELMRLFGSDKLPDWLKEWSDDEDTPIEMGIFTKSIQKAQEKVESHHFDIRKSVLDYDNVMNEQRKVIYEQRDRVLKGEDLKPQMINFIEEYIDRLLLLYASADFHYEDWDLESLYNSCRETFIPLPDHAKLSDLETTDRKKIREKILDWALEIYNSKEEKLGSDLMRILERWVLLQIVDSKWIDHLATMDQLREGIGLRAYGQRDPLVEYINESHEYFSAMSESIRMDTVKFLFRAQVSAQALEEHHQRKVHVTREHRGDGEYGQTTVRKGKKVGRNDPCPCGSGKKYKKCCGRI